MRSELIVTLAIGATVGAILTLIASYALLKRGLRKLSKDI